ncbi:hypothetical protein D3C81_1613010 [compost metagenome]
MSRHIDVVKTSHGNLLRHIHLTFAQYPEHTERHKIVCGENGRRGLLQIQEIACGSSPCLHGVVPSCNVLIKNLQACFLHRFAVTVEPSGGSARGGEALDESNSLVI